MFVNQRKVKPGWELLLVVLLALPGFLPGETAGAQTVDPAPANLLANPDLPINREVNLDTPYKQGPQTKEVLTPAEALKAAPEVDTDPSLVAPDTDSALQAEPRFVLKALVIRGATVLDASDFEPILSSWIGKTVGFEELDQIVASINALYHQHGYITTRAVIEPQAVQNGRVLVQVLEGRLGDIQVVGNKYVRDKYLLRHFTQDKGDVFQIQHLERDMRKLNRDPLLARIHATLVPGEEVATSDIRLEVQDVRPYHLQLSFDNLGRELIGLYHQSVTFSNANLLGRGDSLLMNLMLSTNGRTIAPYGEYKMPINRWGWKVGVSQANNLVRLGGRLAHLDISSVSKQTSLFTEIPLYQSDRWTVQGNLSLNFYDSDVYLRDVSLQDLTGQPFDNLRPWGLGITVGEQDKTGRFVLQGKVENGVGWLGGNSKYVRFNADLMRIQSLGKGFLLVLRGQAQLTPENLPGLVQYQLGGTNSIRGVAEGLYIGDKGYLVSGELRFPLPIVPRSLRSGWQGLAFVDHGGVFITGPDNGPQARGTPGYLTSYGFGIRGRLTRFISARADVGIVADQIRDQPDLRIHFGLSSLLF